MDVSTIGRQVIESGVFGAVVAAIYYLIAGAPAPWPWRQWLALAWALACLCYIILFGAIKA